MAKAKQQIDGASVEDPAEAAKRSEAAKKAAATRKARRQAAAEADERKDEALLGNPATERVDHGDGTTTLKSKDGHDLRGEAEAITKASANTIIQGKAADRTSLLLGQIATALGLTVEELFTAQDDDTALREMLRAKYGYTGAITGRHNAADPQTSQEPNRGEFKARVDYTPVDVQRVLNHFKTKGEVTALGNKIMFSVIEDLMAAAAKREEQHTAAAKQQGTTAGKANELQDQVHQLSIGLEQLARLALDPECPPERLREAATRSQTVATAVTTTLSPIDKTIHIVLAGLREITADKQVLRPVGSGARARILDVVEAATTHLSNLARVGAGDRRALFESQNEVRRLREELAAAESVLDKHEADRAA